MTGDARNNGSRDKRGNGIAHAMNPARGYRDELERKGVTPKNHMAKNKQQLRQAQEKNRIRREEEERKASAPKASAYSHVRSRLHEKSSTNKGTPRSHRPSTAASSRSSRSSSSSRSSPVKRPSTHKGRRDPDLRETDRRDFGKVPQYLKDRKNELARADERRRRREEEEQTPRGMVLMSEGERQHTLSILRENRTRIQQELARMPLRVETMGQKRKKEKLDFKLEEIEKAEKLFMKKKVYITE